MGDEKATESEPRDGWAILCICIYFYVSQNSFPANQNFQFLPNTTGLILATPFPNPVLY